MNSVQIIVTKKQCTGCCVCFSACPNGSIAFILDKSIGHPVPLISLTDCTNCGACLSSCPTAALVVV